MRDVGDARGGQRTARPALRGSARTPLRAVVANTTPIEPTHAYYLPDAGKPASRPLQCATLETFAAGSGLPALPLGVVRREFGVYSALRCPEISIKRWSRAALVSALTALITHQVARFR